MMKKFLITGILVTLYFTLLNSTFVFAGGEIPAVNAGNRLFGNGDYDAALVKYNEAVEDAPESAIVQYNMGAAHYKKEDFDSAVDAFNQALMTDDQILESNANYNLGNCKYKQGRLKENTDLQAAVNLFRDAMAYYKRAIELN